MRERFVLQVVVEAEVEDTSVMVEILKGVTSGLADDIAEGFFEDAHGIQGVKILGQEVRVGGMPEGGHMDEVKTLATLEVVGQRVVRSTVGQAYGNEPPRVENDTAFLHVRLPGGKVYAVVVPAELHSEFSTVVEEKAQITEIWLK